jgi:hypothetical protein
MSTMETDAVIAMIECCSSCLTPYFAMMNKVGNGQDTILREENKKQQQQQQQHQH